MGPIHEFGDWLTTTLEGVSKSRYIAASGHGSGGQIPGFVIRDWRRYSGVGPNLDSRSTNRT